MYIHPKKKGCVVLYEYVHSLFVLHCSRFLIQGVGIHMKLSVYLV